MSLTNERFLWRVFCTTGQNYEFVVSETEPTQCPSDAGPIDSNATIIIDSFFKDIVSEGYINIESLLADNQAIRIINGDPNGGMDFDVGFGGITIDSTNTISLDAAAYSNFTTIQGNLDLGAIGGTGATGGLLNLDADSGINIGNEASTNATNTPIINLGTSSLEKSIAIGNQTAGTNLNLSGGTGGVNINTTGQALILSTSSASDAIRFNTAGGLDIDTSGDVNIASGSSAGSAITLDTAFNNGGITISAGSQGIAINANGGVVGIGHWSGGNMLIGTAALARIITIGNTTSTTGVIINAGTGGITIGNDANAGEVHIGNVAHAKTVIVGNSTGASRLFTRSGSGGLVKTQLSETGFSDADQTPTIANLLNGIMTMTPTTTRTITLPAASAVVSGIGGAQVNDSIDFTIINLDSTNNITVAGGTGSTLVGNMSILPNISGLFRARITNVTVSSETYTIYRIA